MGTYEQSHANIQRPLYMFAIDHRDSFRSMLSKFGGDRGLQHRSELKLTAWQGVKSVLQHVPKHARAAVLVDRANPQITADARSAGIVVALALEKSGRRTLCGEATASMLRQDLCSLGHGIGKVLIRWDPKDSPSHKQRQLRALRELGDVVADAGANLLVELLIPSPQFPEARGPSANERAGATLPRLQLQAVEEVLESGIAPALWKMQGHADAAAAAQVAAAVGSATPRASILILGGGSGIAGLRQVFACRTGNERLNGFAVGRSIWQGPILSLCRGSITKAEAQRAIGSNFLSVIGAFESAARAEAKPC